ncbi:MAG: metal-dependent transcriptional regulator [Lachnospiraceae bacterium]|nr:metal-dependent transcriptional regulator [Lachnospiraceae bacterium]
MRSNESAEDYLETILILGRRLPAVRGVDIAAEMGFRKSSVSVAMKNLREKGHITVSEQGFILLTESGKKIAESVYDRHRTITEWLVSLGVKPETAEADACRIEHVISEESFEAIKKLTE